jgi:hypothetical protein
MPQAIWSYSQCQGVIALWIVCGFDCELINAHKENKGPVKDNPFLPVLVKKKPAIWQVFS